MEMTPERMDALLPRPGEVNATALMVGGPKDQWVITVPMHWELTDDKRDTRFVPPGRIATAIGDYLPDGTQVGGSYRYVWVGRESGD